MLETKNLTMKREAEKEILEFLAKKPSKKTLKYLAIFSFVLLIISMFFVVILLDMSNFSGTLEETQIGFNGAYIKSKFVLMNENELNLFILANIFDYGFMLAYGTLFFSIALMLTRKLKEGSIFKKIGYLITILGICSACCDALENVFLLLMASNPSGFPTWLAIPHSTFALAKFTLMYIVFGWILLISLSRLFVKKQN